MACQSLGSEQTQSLCIPLHRLSQAIGIAIAPVLWHKMKYGICSYLPEIQYLGQLIITNPWFNWLYLLLSAMTYLSVSLLSGNFFRLKYSEYQHLKASLPVEAESSWGQLPKKHMSCHHYQRNICHAINTLTKSIQLLKQTQFSILRYAAPSWFPFIGKN